MVDFFDPRIVTVSPSLMNLLSVPSGIATGLVPFQEISRIDPKDHSLGPEIVPDAIISPPRILHPLTV